MQNENLRIRPATLGMLDRIQEVFAQARAAIAALGIDQWQDGYPTNAHIEADIAAGAGYVLTEGNRVQGYFALLTTPDPTYKIIYDGAWLTEGEAYVTLHRVAMSDELRGKGGADKAVSFAVARALRTGLKSVRIDTHEGNVRMRKFLAKQGFSACGTIYLESGASRVAYERVLDAEYKFAPVVLYEDRNIIICEKPVGQPCQPDPAHADGSDLLSCLAKWRTLCGFAPDVWLVHRLDTATGGAIVYAKDKDSAARLGGMMIGKQIFKQYLAVVHGTPVPAQGKMVDLLYHDKAKNKAFVVDGQRRGVKQASLSYKTLATDGEVSLVLVTLETGRTHQIRAQMSHAGHPLLGDGKYGSREKRCTPALWAHRLGVTHPATGSMIEVQSNPPKEYPWRLFDI
ncbi:MAG: GNAT family N-acetyltransferase [Clostridia bacterium]|nr:GNAT family N-acetyltransferase [Clostridia bacterium]